jgi:hypothetical protein
MISTSSQWYCSCAARQYCMPSSFVVCITSIANLYSEDIRCTAGMRSLILLENNTK